MKSTIEKFRVQNDSFPKSLTITNEGITDRKSKAEKFNSIFVNTGTNVAAKIWYGTTSFESYLPNITTTFRENSLPEEELKKAFVSLKTNKSDNIHVNMLSNELAKNQSFWYFSKQIRALWNKSKKSVSVSKLSIKL